MGIFSTLFYSMINPIGETVKTVVNIYRMAGKDNKRSNLREVAFYRLSAAQQINNPNVNDVARLYNENFFDFINDDIALFIFALMMAESDKFNKEFSNDPKGYFFKIESAVIKQLHTYKPNRDNNYFIAQHLAMTFGKFNSNRGHRPTY